MAKTDADESFCLRMRKAAHLAGNATRLASETGISRRAIGDYLAGQAEPSRPRLVAIARAAGVQVEWLATGAGPMKLGESQADLFAAQASRLDIDRLVEAWRTVEEMLNSRGVKVDQRKMLQLVTLLYDMYTEREAEREYAINQIVSETLVKSG